MKNYNKTIKNLFLSAVAVSTLASCQKDFYLEDLEDSQKVVASLEFTNENLTAEIALLERNIDAAHYTITQNETAIAGLEGDNAALTIENDILKAIIEGLEASIYVLEELLKEKDDAILVLDSSSTTYQTEVTNLTAEREVLLVQMNDDSAELADAINKIYALEVLILAQADTIVTLEFENAALRAEVEVLRAQLAGAGAGVDTSTEALAAVQAELDAANGEILSLTDTVSTTEAENVDLQTRLDAALEAGDDSALVVSLRAEIASNTLVLGSNRTYIMALENAVDRLDGDLVTATTSLTAAIQDLEDLQSEIDGFVETLALKAPGSTAVENGFTLTYILPQIPTSLMSGIRNQIYNSTMNVNNFTVRVQYGYQGGSAVLGGEITVTFSNVLDATLFYISNLVNNDMQTSSAIADQTGFVSASTRFVIADDKTTTDTYTN